MNEWMNEFFKKEHTGPPRTCGYEESTPRGQHSARTALMLVHCQRTAWTRPLLPQRPWRRGGEGSQSGSRPCSALAHAAMPRLRSRGEQATHIPPQDNRHVHWPGVLRFMWSQRVGHDCVTELTELKFHDDWSNLPLYVWHLILLANYPFQVLLMCWCVSIR